MLVLRRCSTIRSLSLPLSLFWSRKKKERENQQQNKPERQKLTGSRLLPRNVCAILFGYLSAIWWRRRNFSPLPTVTGLSITIFLFYFFSKRPPSDTPRSKQRVSDCGFHFGQRSLDRGGRGAPLTSCQPPPQQQHPSLPPPRPRTPLPLALVEERREGGWEGGWEGSAFDRGLRGTVKSSLK